MVALVGQPNTGKSTLTNLLVGQKVSIVSDKAQTTRHRVLGIATTDAYQMVIIDTPGVHKAHTHLGKVLNETAQGSLEGADVLIVMVDGSRKPDKNEEAIVGLLKLQGWIGADGKARPNVILCMNKMDLLKAVDVQDNFQAYSKLYGTDQVMMTTLPRGRNVDKLVNMIIGLLPVGPLLYPEDEVTDQPMRRLAAELVREKALRLTRQEIPHAVAAIVDDWVDDANLTKILISLVVEKEGQKAVLIGKRGEMIKKIGTEARGEIEAVLDRRVFLELFVKVRPDWRQNPRMLKELDYI
ncbi:MAG: GTPase Era [Fimbriimonadaceae bacterium]|nr:GTPase Era [Fimbriimonadaceae bacterium]